MRTGILLARINCNNVEEVIEMYEQEMTSHRKRLEEIFYKAHSCETEEDQEMFRSLTANSNLDNLAGDFIVAVKSGNTNMLNLRPHGFDGAYLEDNGHLIEREIKKISFHKEGGWRIMFGNGKISKSKATRYNNPDDYILTLSFQDRYKQDLFFVSGSASNLGDVLTRYKGEVSVKRLLSELGFKIYLAPNGLSKQQIVDAFKKRYPRFNMKDNYFN